MEQIKLEVGKTRRGKITVSIPFEELLEDFEKQLQEDRPHIDDHSKFEVFVISED